MRLEHIQESQQAGAEASPDGIISKALALGRHLQPKPLPVMEFFHLYDKILAFMVTYKTCILLHGSHEMSQ